MPACLPLPSIFLSLTTLKYVIMGKKDTLRQTERRVGWWWWLHYSTVLCTSIAAVSKHLSASGAKLPNRQDEAALEATLNPSDHYMHRQQRYKLRVSELQTSVTSSESHTKPKEEGDNPTHVRNGTDPQYSGAG
jgi:hypothetical protein